MVVSKQGVFFRVATVPPHVSELVATLTQAELDCSTDDKKRLRSDATDATLLDAQVGNTVANVVRVQSRHRWRHEEQAKK